MTTTPEPDAITPDPDADATWWRVEKKNDDGTWSPTPIEWASEGSGLVSLRGWREVNPRTEFRLVRFGDDVVRRRPAGAWRVAPADAEVPRG